jgi:hypothetical protein
MMMAAMQGCLPCMPFPMQGQTPVPTDEAQREFSKIYLTNQKQQLVRALKSLADYQKGLEESLGTVEKQLAKLEEVDTEQKKAPSQGKHTGK